MIVVITTSPATLSRVSQGWTQYKTCTLKLKFGQIANQQPQWSDFGVPTTADLEVLGKLVH